MDNYIRVIAEGDKGETIVDLDDNSAGFKDGGLVISIISVSGNIRYVDKKGRNILHIMLAFAPRMVPLFLAYISPEDRKYLLKHLSSLVTKEGESK